MPTTIKLYYSNVIPRPPAPPTPPTTCLSPPPTPPPTFSAEKPPTTQNSLLPNTSYFQLQVTGSCGGWR